MTKIIGGIILGVIAIIIWSLRARYDPDVLKEQAKKKQDEELDKKKARLKWLNMTIDETAKDLSDSINLKNNASVNQLSALLNGLRKERDELRAQL